LGIGNFDNHVIQNITLQKYYESINEEFLPFFHHKIKLAKFLSGLKNFKYPEICHYHLGVYYKTNYWASPIINKEYLEYSVKYYETARDSKKLPKKLADEIALGISKSFLKD